MEKIDLVVWGVNAVLFGGYFLYDLFQARNINEAKNSFLDRGTEALKEKSVMNGAWDFYITSRVTGPFTYFAKKNFKKEVLQ